MKSFVEESYDLKSRNNFNKDIYIRKSTDMVININSHIQSKTESNEFINLISFISGDINNDNSRNI